MATISRSGASARSRLVLAGALVIGLVALWVGQASAQVRDFPAHVHDHHLCDAKDSPMGSLVVVAPGSAPHHVSFGAAGEIPCSEVGRGHCPGYVYHHPIAIDVVAPMRVNIEVMRSSTDTVLALVGPRGRVRSDDDGGWGTLSRINTHLRRGRYLLYAGTYHYGALGHMTVSIGDASPVRVVHPASTPPPHRPPHYDPSGHHHDHHGDRRHGDDDHHGDRRHGHDDDDHDHGRRRRGRDRR